MSPGACAGFSVRLTSKGDGTCTETSPGAHMARTVRTLAATHRGSCIIFARSSGRQRRGVQVDVLPAIRSNSRRRGGGTTTHRTPPPPACGPRGSPPPIRRGGRGTSSEGASVVRPGAPWPAPARCQAACARGGTAASADRSGSMPLRPGRACRSTAADPSSGRTVPAIRKCSRWDSASAEAVADVAQDADGCAAHTCRSAATGERQRRSPRAVRRGGGRRRCRSRRRPRRSAGGRGRTPSGWSTAPRP